MLDAMQARRKNFHIPLDEELHERLRREAVRSGRPATDLAREAIEASLAQRARTLLHEEIAGYATAVAGSAADLDPELEQVAVEQLTAKAAVSKRSRKRRRS
jgi:hypothetical protein